MVAISHVAAWPGRCVLGLAVMDCRVHHFAADHHTPLPQDVRARREYGISPCAGGLYVRSRACLHRSRANRPHAAAGCRSLLILRIGSSICCGSLPVSPFCQTPSALAVLDRFCALDRGAEEMGSGARIFCGAPRRNVCRASIRSSDFPAISRALILSFDRQRVHPVSGRGAPGVIPAPRLLGTVRSGYDRVHLVRLVLLEEPLKMGLARSGTNSYGCVGARYTLCLDNR